MKSWLIRLFAPRLAPAEARPRTASVRASATCTHGTQSVEAASPRTTAALPLGDQASLDLEFLAWLAKGTEFVVAPAGSRERAALRHLDRVIADEASHQRLLPRAAAVIPPLLARLRNPSLALAELSQHVSRDVTLVAEVVRMANSPFYRRGELVVELDHAIRLLGVDGMRRAIARALLKPLIDARGGRLVTCSATRLWDHSDKKAQLCAALAAGVGIEPFEAYLAGLAHNAVWSAMLRAMDEVDGEPPWHLSPAFVTALGGRRDRLFAVVARQWQLADSVSRAAADRAEQGTAARTDDPKLALLAALQAAPAQRSGPSPGTNSPQDCVVSGLSPEGSSGRPSTGLRTGLGAALRWPEASAPMRLLYTGDRLAWLLCAPDRVRATSLVEPWLRTADDAVRACYHALELAPATAA